MLLCIFCLVWWRGQGLPGKMEPTGSDICCLTSDKDGLHDWCTWGASRVPRSCGACLEVGRGQSPSRTFSPRKPINFKQGLIIWGVIANQMDPFFWLECTLSFHAKQEATSLSALLFSLQFVFSPYFQLHLSHNCDGGYFLLRVEKLRQQEWSK